MSVAQIDGDQIRPKVWPIAWTSAQLPVMTAASGGGWQPDPDATDAESLLEFAGRACYQSWSKPNPATATTAGYLRHILEVGHLSVLEHGSATFYITGVSRSFTHELVRHRHLSYSQLSQRYVAAGLDSPVVEPDAIADDPDLHRAFTAAMDSAYQAYGQLLQLLDDKLAGGAGTSTGRRKQARQAARAVLPNAAETRIVVSGNFRAWRHFVNLRATEHADVEIRQVAVKVLRRLQEIAPRVFADYQITTLADGTEVAASSITTE